MVMWRFAVRSQTQRIASIKSELHVLQWAGEAGWPPGGLGVVDQEHFLFRIWTPQPPGTLCYCLCERRFWYSCRLVTEWVQLFRQAYCLHLQGARREPVWARTFLYVYEIWGFRGLTQTLYCSGQCLVWFGLYAASDSSEELTQALRDKCNSCVRRSVASRIIHKGDQLKPKFNALEPDRLHLNRRPLARPPTNIIPPLCLISRV